MEAFSRPLWALGSFWAGGGRDAALEAIYRNGFAHGADPKAAEYWGTLGDCDQCFVEMAAFACAMIEAPAIVWDPLSEKARQDFAAWFDTDGAAVPYGRSLTYRFAQSAFYAACLWAGLAPLPLPVMKGILVRNLQWWLSKPIFDRDGVLTVGYCYPTLLMSEEYNAPGSPYWAMKTFRLLALPDDHPFWSAEAATACVLKFGPTACSRSGRPSPALRSKPRSAPPQPDISAGTKSTVRSPAPPGTAALRCRAMRRVIPPRQKTAWPRRPTQRWAAPCAATERPKCSTPGPIPISMTPTAPFPPGVMQSMPATASGIAKL